MVHKAWCSIKKDALLFFEVIHQISRLHGPNIDDLSPILSKITRPVTAKKSLGFALFTNIFDYVFCETIFEMTTKISHDLGTIWHGRMTQYLKTTTQNKTLICIWLLGWQNYNLSRFRKIGLQSSIDNFQTKRSMMIEDHIKRIHLEHLLRFFLIFTDD